MFTSFYTSPKTTPVHLNDSSSSSVGENVLVTEIIVWFNLWLERKNLPQIHFEMKHH